MEDMRSFVGHERYVFLDFIGQGSYGTVFSARDLKTGKKVAIKKICNVFSDKETSKRILRELIFLRVLKHADLVSVKNILLPVNLSTYQDIYVVMELMDSDMSDVLADNVDTLTDEHHRTFLYQLLRGLNFMHQSRVLHRDLKTKNIVVNADCKVKLCDFGLSRIREPNNPDGPVMWSDYVATRWYRPPELVGLLYGAYNEKVDIWSMGCIFGEILRSGMPLFPGKDVSDMFRRIINGVGTPSAEVVQRITNPHAIAFLHRMQPRECKINSNYFPRASEGALGILRRMLNFDPATRPSAAELLADPYFATLPNAVSTVPARINVAQEFAFEAMIIPEPEMRRLLYNEMLRYHPVIAEGLAIQQINANAALFYQEQLRVFREMAYGTPAIPARGG